MRTNKPSAIPRLEQLPAEQTAALVRWLTEDHLSYAQALARLKAEFSVKTSPAALSAFWHSVCVPRQAIERMRRDMAAVKGKVLVEIQIRSLPDRSLNVAVVGGQVPAYVETASAPDSTTIRVLALAPGASAPEPEYRGNSHPCAKLCKS